MYWTFETFPCKDIYIIFQSAVCVGKRRQGLQKMELIQSGSFAPDDDLLSLGNKV